MAAFTQAKPYFASMSTVISIDVSGINIRDEEAVEKLVRQHVEPRVKTIVDTLKASSQKFEDPDFGPTEKDPRGAVSFYGTAMPAPAGSKYPKPEDLRWDRPHYDDKGMFAEGKEKKEGEDGEEDEEEEEDEEGGVWCKHGGLFLEGSSSGDVIQGQLGDCWFLGALAVMGANEELLLRCFWRLETFKEFGFFVCRFYKDTNMIFVIVDDRIPVKEKDGKVIFAACKDPNELWVPIIEKAYAKLHGCYKALIGGYSHYALADMTGYCPRLLVMKPGFPGYSDAMTKEDVWATLQRYRKWGCLMGTSIQSNPKENHKVEAEAGMGLHMGHAYSFVDLGTIQVDGKPVNLVKLRNPWGRGEWEGTYSDRSDEMEREDIQEELTRVMKPDVGAEVGNFNDGSFFMPFDDWFERFTSLFVAINFPPEWTGKRAAGRWTGEAGGNREMTSWLSNPKLRFKLNSAKPGPVQVFVGLYIKDSRLTMGFDYYKDPLYATPLAFDIVTKSFLDGFEKPLGKEATIDKGRVVVGRPDAKPRQAPYNFGTTQVEIMLDPSEEYFIVPSLYKRSVPGDYSLTVYAECDFELEGASKLGGGGGEQLMAKKSDKGEEPTMSKTQFFEKVEALRERLVAEAKKLGLTMQTLRGVFPEPLGGKPVEDLSYADFKKKLLALGFNLTDLSDADLTVLDATEPKTINPRDFLAFFSLGLDMEETAKKDDAPPPPVDDLAFKAADMEGVLTVKVSEARALREAQAWFSALKDAGSNESSLPKARKLIRYDAAQRTGLETRAAKIGARLRAEREALVAAAAKKKAKLQQQQDAPLSTTANDAMTSAAVQDLTADLFSSPIGRRQGGGGGNTPRDDAHTVRSAIGDLLSSAGEMAAVKLHGDKDLQEAERRRTRDLKALRNLRQSRAAEDRTAEIQEAGGLRKKTALALKVDRRMLTKDRAALALLGLDAPTLRAKDWYAPHKDDKDRDLVGVRSDRPTQPAVSKIVLPCKCVFRTMGVLPFLKSKNACPSCGVSFAQMSAGTGWGAGGGAAIAGGGDASGAALSTLAVSDAKETKDEALAVQAVAVTPGNPSRGPTQFTLFKRPDEVPVAPAAPTVDFTATQALAPLSLAGGAPAPPLVPSAAALAAATALAPDVEIKVVFGETAPGSPGLITLVDARDKNVVVFDYNKSEFLRQERPSPSATAPELEGGGDLWDSIIDRVAIISDSRGRGKESAMNAAIRSLEKGLGRITKDDFKAFSRAVSAIPSPSVTIKANPSKPQAVKLGTAPTPKNLKKTPGTASVTTQRNAAALHADMLSVATSDKLRQLEAERYDEVFRRLVSVPSVYLNELEGERGSGAAPGVMGGKGFSSHLGAFAMKLFEKMDLNANGSISLDEFRQALVGMNIDVSQDDALTLFARFEKDNDGTIDWDEFSHFFHTHIATDLPVEAVNAPYLQTRSMRHVLSALHAPLHAAHKEMTRRRMRSVEGLAHVEEAVAAPPTDVLLTPFELPDNAILHRLDDSSCVANVTTLRMLGAVLTLEEMQRVGFVFKNDVRRLMAFAASEEMHIGHATITAIQTIIRRLKTRAGDRPVTAAVRDEMTSDNVVRLWALVSAFATKYPAASSTSTVPVDALADYMEQMVMEGRAPRPVVEVPAADAVAAADPASSAATAPPAVAAPLLSPRPDPKDVAVIGGVAVETLCRVVADGIQHSSWNRGGGGVAFSAFEAFVREAHVNSIERKLRYLLELELSLAGPSTLALVHVYVNESKSEAVVLVHEPLLGTVYKMVVTEDLTALPSDPESLRALFPWADETRARARGGANQRVQHTLYPKILSDASFSLFNPVETPDEDAAISELVQRLRIIKGTNAAKLDADRRLILAEDPRFVAQLKRLLDSVPALPFFCNCNDTNLYFDTDRDTLAAEGSIRHLVFGHIRRYKPLHTFLVSVISELRVVLSSYNSGVKVCMPWCEMLAHLTEYRNPYVSVELKPRFLEPHEYIYRPEDRREAFTGNEEADPLAVQRSDVVIDGGSHPVFRSGSQFKIQFRPPKLTSCKLVSTEIHKMEIDGELKYVILMAREAKRDRSSEHLLMPTKPGDDAAQPRYYKLPDRLETFRFLTIYDPRTATDYQCGVMSGCALFDALMEPPANGGESEAVLDKVRSEFDALGPDKGDMLSFEAVQAALCRDALAAIRQETDAALDMAAVDGKLTFQAFLRLSARLAPELVPDDAAFASPEALDKACAKSKELDKERERFIGRGGVWLGGALGGAGAGAAATVEGGPTKAAVAAPEVTGGAIAGGASAAAGATTAVGAAAAPARSLFAALLSDSKSRLFEALSKSKMQGVQDAALKRVTAADTNGDGRISFCEFARMFGRQVGHGSGKYDPHPDGPCSAQDFMRHVEEAARLNLVLLGPAITPRLLLAVVNARGKQEEVLGSCQVSISSVLSGSGTGREQWVKLSHWVPGGEGNSKLPDKPVPAGAVQVELGFRKQAEIDAELQAERDRKERRAKGIVSRPNTPRGNTPRSAAPAPKAVAFAAAPAVDPVVVRERDELAKEIARLKATASAAAAVPPALAPAPAAASASAVADVAAMAALAKEREELAVEVAKLKAAAAAAAATASKMHPSAPAPVDAAALAEAKADAERLSKEVAKLKAGAQELEVQKAKAAEQARTIHELEAKLKAATALSSSAPTAAKKTGKDADKSMEPLSLGLSGNAVSGQKPLSPGRAPSKEAKQAGGGQSRGQQQPQQPQQPLGARPSSRAAAPNRSPTPAAWVDWNTAPLPAGWDRKTDAASGKVSCFAPLRVLGFFG